MKRPFLWLLAAILFAFHSVEAQQPEKVLRIGYLQSGARPTIEAIQRELRNVGYLEGKNVVFDGRDAEGKAERFPELAAELVRRKADIIVAVNEVAAQAAKNATPTIPIVMVRVGRNPVEAGLVESLARPGGNVTGVVNLAVELTGKRLELFKEALPQLGRVDTLYDPTIRGTVEEAKHVQTIGRGLRLGSKSWEVRGAGDIEKVFALLINDRPDALHVGGGPTLTANRKLIADLALKSRMPSLHVSKDWVESGCLMSYGVDLADHYRRAAWYIDKVLKGAKPADLPVEQATKFELVINLNTAKQIGVTIPPSVLARADKVIK